MRSIGELCRDILSMLVAENGKEELKGGAERAETAEEELQIVKSKVDAGSATVNLAHTEVNLEKVHVTPWGRDIRESAWRPAAGEILSESNQVYNIAGSTTSTNATRVDVVEHGTVRKRLRFVEHIHTAGHSSNSLSSPPVRTISQSSQGVKFLSCDLCEFVATSFSDLQLHFALVHMRSDATVPKGSVRSRNELEGVSDPGEVIKAPFNRPVTAPIAGALRLRRRRRRKRKQESKKRRPIFSDPTFSYQVPLSPKPWLRSGARDKKMWEVAALDEEFSHSIRLGTSLVDVRIARRKT